MTAAVTSSTPHGHTSHADGGCHSGQPRDACCDSGERADVKVEPWVTPPHLSLSKGIGERERWCLIHWHGVGDVIVWLVDWPGAGIMEADDGQVTTFSQSSRHSIIGTRQIEYHEALPSSEKVQSHFTSSFADDGNASWYSVCRVPKVEWQLDCENCRHLAVVGLHDTGPRFTCKIFYSCNRLLGFRGLPFLLLCCDTN